MGQRAVLAELVEDTRRADSEQGSSDRTFGFVFSGAFAAIGLLPLLHGHPIRIWALVVAAAFLTVAAVKPGVIQPLNRLWTRFGLLLQKITNPIIMGVLFLVVITPMAIGLRLLKKDLLRLRTEEVGATYWINRAQQESPEESMRHQF